MNERDFYFVTGQIHSNQSLTRSHSSLNIREKRSPRTLFSPASKLSGSEAGVGEGGRLGKSESFCSSFRVYPPARVSRVLPRETTGDESG